ncbi:MAG: CBS domain-containing protein [Chloroflexi bacterium]|nr:CBS domain-containing protein [Chloroflexota bacterium]
MLVKDVMTKKVITVGPDTPLAEIARTLLERGVSGVPVVDESNRVVGVVAEEDLIQRIRSERKPGFWKMLWAQSLLGDPDTAAETYLKEHGDTAAELMSHPPICVTADLALGDAVALMHRHRINRVPVIEKDGRLVGILARADVLRALASGAGLIGAADTSPANDAELEQRVRQALELQPWAPIGVLDLEVKNGVVKVEGSCTTDSIVKGIERIIREVPGVRSVRNEMSTVAPIIPGV